MPVPGKAVLLIKSPGADILLEDVQETAGIACCFQTAENLLHYGGAVTLPPVVRVGVEGDQLSPIGQIGGAELADGVPGGVVYSGGAIGGAAEGAVPII